MGSVADYFDNALAESVFATWRACGVELGDLR